MKLKAILFFFILQLTLSSFGSNKELNYSNYHLRLYDAESMIINQDLDSALLIYQAVFDQYKNHFFKDINNAFYCCIGLKKYDTAKDYAEELVLHGYELKDFDKEELAEFKSTKIWRKFKRNYSKLREQYQASIDQDLRKIYDKIHVLDQKAAVSGDTKLMHSVYYKHASQLSKIFVDKGFKTIGINKDLQDVHIYAVLRHYYFLRNQLKRWPELYMDEMYEKMKSDSLPLLKQFKMAIHEGNILPEYYASSIVYGDDASKAYYGKPMFFIDFETKKISFTSFLSTERLKVVNEKRYEIGLYPINASSNSLIQSTWYKEYPFKAIIKKLSSIDSTCSVSPLRMITDEELKVENRFEKRISKTNFILSDLNNINETCVGGFRQYIKK
jgi:hypothetical protein